MGPIFFGKVRQCFVRAVVGFTNFWNLITLQNMQALFYISVSQTFYSAYAAQTFGKNCVAATSLA